MKAPTYEGLQPEDKHASIVNDVKHCVQIGKVKRRDDKVDFEMDFDALETVFRQNDVEHTNIAVLSIVGSYRTGKSFLLNLLHHYFKRDSVATSDARDELNSLFESHASTKAITKGIWISKNPIWIESQGPSKVALFLIDTEGLFDGKQKSIIRAKMLAMTSVITSYSIINLLKQFEENHLEYFQMYVEYGKGLKPNQVGVSSGESAMIVIRDWQGHKEYGLESGTKYLGDQRTDASEEYMNVLSRIDSFYDQLECCLLPDPGDSVKGEKVLNLEAINETFRDEVKNLKKLLATKISPKQHDGTPLTGRKMVQICKLYAKHMEVDDETKVLNLKAAHDELEMMTVKQKCRSMFVNPKEIFESKSATVKDLEDLKASTLEQVLLKFDTSMECHHRTEWVSQHRETLTTDLNNVWETNESALKDKKRMLYEKAQLQALQLFQTTFEKEYNESKNQTTSIESAEKQAMERLEQSVDIEFLGMKEDSFRVVKDFISHFERFSQTESAERNSPDAAIKTEHEKILSELYSKLITSQVLDNYNSKFEELLEESSINDESKFQTFHDELKRKLISHNVINWTELEPGQVETKLDERFEFWKRVNRANIDANYSEAKTNLEKFLEILVAIYYSFKNLGK